MIWELLVFRKQKKIYQKWEENGLSDEQDKVTAREEAFL